MQTKKLYLKNKLTSFCTVIFTLIFLECGSVHKNVASTNRTFCKELFILFKQTASNSRDSFLAITHDEGGDKNLHQRNFCI